MANIEIISKYSRISKRVDAEATIEASVRALPVGTAFSTEDVKAALEIAHPGDAFTVESALRWVSQVLSNPMSSASQFICEEVSQGQYVRK